MKRAKSLLAVLCLGISLLLPGCTAPAGEKNKVNLLAEGTVTNDLNSVQYQTMAETEALVLQINPDTTEFQVIVKATGYVWKSAPENAALESDRAVLSVSYMDSSGVVQQMNSYTDAVKKGQYSITPLTSGIKLEYSLGDIESQYYAPLILSEERYEKYYTAMSSTDQRFMRQMYSLIDLNSYSGSDRKEIEQKYPQAKDGRIYVLTPNMQKTVKQRLSNALKEAGYTDQDKMADAAYGGELTQKEQPQFHIALYLELEKDTLRAKVPTEELFYYKDYPMEQLNVLTNFGRAGFGTEGYYLLPDGSGSVMDFYNGKQNLQAYSVAIYGSDKAVSAIETTFREQQAIFPIFGCALTQGNGFLTVIEDGDALASVNASPGNSQTPPVAYAAFTVVQKAKIATRSTTESNTSYFVTHQTSVYHGNYQLAYHFLTGDEANYNGMARLYQRLLLGERELIETTALPLYLRVVGQASIRENVLGLSIEKALPLTSFQNVETIVKELREGGIDHLELLFTGYLSGGLRQEYLKSASLASAVGDAEDFRKLLCTLNDLDVGYAVEAEVQYAYKNGVFGGPSSKETVRLLSRQPGTCYPTNRAYFTADTEEQPAYILNASGISASFQHLSSLAEKWGVQSLALKSIGSTVNSDYHEKRETERQTSLKLLVEETTKLKKRVERLVVSQGQAPFAALADGITELPLHSCSYDITDYSVPFTAMVLSGYVPYSASAANLEYADKNDYLRLLETGAAPSYLIGAQNTEKLRNGDYSELYAIDFAALKDRLYSDYAWLSKAMADTYGHRIVSHNRLSENVYRTDFEGGLSVIVNYNNVDVIIEDGRTVSAKDYLYERS